METTKENLLDKFDALPDAVKEAITSVETANKMYSIGKENGLNIDKIGILATQTGYVMVGVLPSKNFILTLKDKLGVNEETAYKIAKSVNEEVFFEVHKHLRKTYNIPPNEDIIEVSSAQHRPSSITIPPKAPEKSNLSPTAQLYAKFKERAAEKEKLPLPKKEALYKREDKPLPPIDINISPPPRPLEKKGIKDFESIKPEYTKPHSPLTEDSLKSSLEIPGTEAESKNFSKSAPIVFPQKTIKVPTHSPRENKKESTEAISSDIPVPPKPKHKIEEFIHKQSDDDSIIISEKTQKPLKEEKETPKSPHVSTDPYRETVLEEEMLPRKRGIPLTIKPEQDKNVTGIETLEKDNTSDKKQTAEYKHDTYREEIE